MYSYSIGTQTSTIIDHYISHLTNQVVVTRSQFTITHEKVATTKAKPMAIFSHFTTKNPLPDTII